jgi:hypothetical protein
MRRQVPGLAETIEESTPCNLVARSPTVAEGGIQAGSGKGVVGQDSEPSELIFFKVYKSQIPVIERAIETAALMLGSDKSRGYCLEMICADFVAGASVEGHDPEILLQSITEDHPLEPTNPYGESNRFVDRMLGWFHKAHGLRYAALRYFNAVVALTDRREAH